MRAISLLCASVILCSSAFANDEQIYLAGKTYINDVYMYILPVPKMYVACMGPQYSGEHGLNILLSSSDCRKVESVPSLAVSGYWSDFPSADAPGAVDSNCTGGGTATRTGVHFGDVILFRCDKRAGNTITYFTVKIVHTSNGSIAISYGVVARNIGGNLSEFESRLDSFLSLARFTTR
jgi:hypothetical protein